jgi:phosphatidylglycerol:prolipoprotein diacylglycerol transferase
MRPVLFYLGHFPIYSYGLTLAMAFLVGIAWTRREARRQGLNPDVIFDLAIYLIIAAVVGGRLGYVLLEWAYYAQYPLAILQIWNGGMSFYGGLFFGLVAGMIFTKKHHLPLGQMADLIAPPLALGYAIVRIGCFLNGCCYGHLTNLPWALDFGDGLRHPTQLYASLINLAIFVILICQRHRKPFAGYLMWLYLGLYGVYRFCIEFFRESEHVISWLTPGQLVSLFLGFLAFSVICRKLLHRRWGQ